MSDRQAVTIPLSHLTVDERYQARAAGMKEIESYNDDSRAGVAETIATVGRELLEAATPYLERR